MCRHNSVLGVVSLIAAFTCGIPSQGREWTDVTGKHRVEAEYVELNNGIVRLRTDDGRIIRVPFTKLSAADRESIRDYDTVLSGKNKQASNDEDKEVALARLRDQNRKLLAENRSLRARLRTAGVGLDHASDRPDKKERNDTFEELSERQANALRQYAQELKDQKPTRPKVTAPEQPDEKQWNDVPQEFEFDERIANAIYEYGRQWTDKKPAPPKVARSQPTRRRAPQAQPVRRQAPQAQPVRRQAQFPRATRPAPIPAGFGPTYIGTGGGHWISDKSGDGSLVTLEDGSIWRISDFSRIDSMLWLPLEDIIVLENTRGITPYLLINKDTGEEAEATFLGTE